MTFASNAIGRLRYRICGPKSLEPLRTFLVASHKKSRPLKATHVIALQCVEDPFYLALFGSIVSGLRESIDLRADCIVIRSLQVGVMTRGRRAFNASRLADWPWVQAYRIFCQNVAYWARKPLDVETERQNRTRAAEIWDDCKTPDALAAIVKDGILLGDLVVDTYLRFKPSAFVDPRDPLILEILIQALRDLSNAQRYFGQHRPAVYLTSYTTYIQHGIAARVAASLGTQVVSFGNLQEVCKFNSVGDMSHTKDASLYYDEFLKLEGKSLLVSLGNQALQKRIDGAIDVASSYMKKSAYSATNNDMPSVQNSVVIVLHDFYDSPHVYKWLLFNDFWEWACFTIEALHSNGVKFFLKPHPNQVEKSGEDVKALRKKYPYIEILPTDVTNRQLADGGIACAVTAYGTVAGEMAFMGVPTICCGDNPHISFPFSITARSREEYADLLAGSVGMAVKKDDLIEQSSAFYYMHNLHDKWSTTADREKFVLIRQSMGRWHEHNTTGEDEIIQLSEFIESSSFRSVLSRIGACYLTAPQEASR